MENLSISTENQYFILCSNKSDIICRKKCLFLHHLYVYKNNIYILAGVKDITMENQEKISITTKTLASGNCQVKFFIEDEKKPQYGYLLVSEPKPVGEIIDEIKQRMERRKTNSLNMNPFFPIPAAPEDHNFYLFSA
jgi:hypothetical protein